MYDTDLFLDRLHVGVMKALQTRWFSFGARMRIPRQSKIMSHLDLLCANTLCAQVLQVCGAALAQGTFASPIIPAALHNIDVLGSIHLPNMPPFNNADLRFEMAASNATPIMK
jgi:hypothetical protein